MNKGECYAQITEEREVVDEQMRNRSQSFFKENQRINKKKLKLGPSGTRFKSRLNASFEISKIIAPSKKPHTIGETLVKSRLIKAIEEVLGFKVKKKKLYQTTRERSTWTDME